jgi:hypothetical protein
MQAKIAAAVTTLSAVAAPGRDLGQMLRAGGLTAASAAAGARSQPSSQRATQRSSNIFF